MHIFGLSQIDYGFPRSSQLHLFAIPTIGTCMTGCRILCYTIRHAGGPRARMSRVMWQYWIVIWPQTNVSVDDGPNFWASRWSLLKTTTGNVLGKRSFRRGLLSEVQLYTLDMLTRKGPPQHSTSWVQRQTIQWRDG